MTPKSLQLFKKKKGIYLNTGQLIAIALTTFLIMISYIEKNVEANFHNIVTVLIVIWVFYIVGFMISNFFRYENERGEYSGKIILWEEKIDINNREFSLSEISKLSFESSYDIKGTFTNSMLEFSPHLSNGLDNVVKVFLKNGERIEYNFLQTKTVRLKNYKEILIGYHKYGIIEWLQLLNILGIHNYEEIQSFKEEVKNYGQQRI